MKSEYSINVIGASVLPLIRPSSVIDPATSLSQLHEQQQYRRRNCAKEVRAHHVREVPFAFIRSSNPTMRRGQTTVASLNTSAKRPPSFGGTNFPHEMPS